MSTIKLLSQEVIGKIAAGEVVERPAAAIKEMVENSLDAGATAVSVDIRDGGISYIRVADNGSGIPSSDIRMAFERHATSKIRTSEELSSVATLGFRGEALASIAAVSKVTCSTRTQADQTGIRIRLQGGEVTSIEEVGLAVGTTIVVNDLFYNTPVRLKFLKKPSVEAAYVTDYMMRFILSHPEVSFRYIAQDKVVYHSPGDGKLSSAVYSVYGQELHQTMREVSGCQGGMIVSGYVGIGESGRGNRTHQSFFINGRYLRSSLLSSALEAACRERVMIGKYPACVLHIQMPYELVDVNVHPNKLEVRFQNEALVAASLEQIVRDAITDRDVLQHPVEIHQWEDDAPPQNQNPVYFQKQTAITRESEPGFSAKPDSVSALDSLISQGQDSTLTPMDNPSTGLFLQEPADHASYLSGDGDNPAEPAATGATRGNSIPVGLFEPDDAAALEQTDFVPSGSAPLRIIGVVFKTYILVEYKDALLMIDQHAVHERLLFDQLMITHDLEQTAQELLVPLIVPVTKQEQMLVERNLDALRQIGFVVESFGEGDVQIRSIPMVLGVPQTTAFFRDVLGQLEGERGVITVEKRRASLLQMACKHAIKGGDTLTDAEIAQLVHQMIDDKVTPTCPHGRPLVVSIHQRELEKWFKRIQS